MQDAKNDLRRAEEATREALTVGVIIPGGSTVPTGFLFCNGQAVPRSNYAALFGIIGTTYGSGDGSTTFNVPDFTPQNYIIKARPKK